MRLHELQPASGSKRKRKIVGRGTGSGRGKTSTRGHKGQRSRSGGKGVRPGFEGGQNPIHLRLPKKGFTNIFRIEYKPINVGRLDKFEDVTEFTKDKLVELGVIGKNDKIKILGNGDISRAITVSADKYSKTAKEKIEATGGKFLEI